MNDDQRTSLVIRTCSGTGPSKTGPSLGKKGQVENEVPQGGEHVVRIRLGGGGLGKDDEGPKDRKPVGIGSPDPADCHRSCTVRISTSPRPPNVSTVGAQSLNGESAPGKKSVTVYLQPWTSDDTPNPPAIEISAERRSQYSSIYVSDTNVRDKRETAKVAAGATMLIKPEEEEMFYSARSSDSSGGGSASSTTGSEAADSGTCSDLDNTSPRPAEWRRPRRAASDEDISSASDSLSDHDHEHDHENDHEHVHQTSSYSNKDKDDFLVFHLNEKDFDKSPSRLSDDQTSFAGRRSLEGESATIRSSRGTIRGVKNRVRAGIATFLSINATKTWQEREAGQVVVYTTTMGIVRETFQRCLKVRHILRTNLVKYTEKDVFMSREVQTELRDRMGASHIELPQVFIEGLHVGDADAIEKLNESGELRKILKPYRSMDACTTCQACGGFRLLPCNVCNGSKKSVHRNQFSTELVALRCMHCDEVGLIKCYAC